MALVLDLAAVRAKHILYRLDGAPPSELSLDEMLWVFRQHGVPLEPELRTDPNARVQRAREFFQLWVEAVITSRFQAIPSEQRRDAVNAILEQFDETAQALRSPTTRYAKDAPVQSRLSRRKSKSR